MLLFGYDPGGVGSNGVAIADFRLPQRPTVLTFTSDSVDEGLEWFRANVGESTPQAIGIDSYLSWATGLSGWRPMDASLRSQFPAVQHSVFSSNSASGSMAVQGMAMAMRVREIWPEIRLNETHPKVQYFALSGNRYSYGQKMIEWLCGQFDPAVDAAITNDHEWDAVISAWATWMGLTGQWTTDLMVGAGDLLLPSGEVTYYWPSLPGMPHQSQDSAGRTSAAKEG